jgi:antitoxin MazE
MDKPEGEKGEIRLFSMGRLIEQYELYKQGKFPPPAEMIDFGDPVGDELGGPDDPSRNDPWNE